ncbi:hypothetical protein Cgig2_022413 [Carnegiea gigantea]|uniref:DUF4283 domain-containing protein n=1 Tax=Carnegiea gigantea TaxID=171969 RepID=A0A9Q1GG65_9CARY|nr:hypothetical protein Cgig2_022413 [Carnegiea gigantea]
MASQRISRHSDYGKPPLEGGYREGHWWSSVLHSHGVEELRQIERRERVKTSGNCRTWWQNTVADWSPPAKKVPTMARWRGLNFLSCGLWLCHGLRLQHDEIDMFAGREVEIKMRRGGKERRAHAASGVYLVRFKTIHDKEAVLSKGIYYFNQKPFIVKAWNEHLEINTSSINSLPIWVQFPELDVKYWGVDSLSKLGSLLGIPLKIDK